MMSLHEGQAGRVQPGRLHPAAAGTVAPGDDHSAADRGRAGRGFARRLPRSSRDASSASSLWQHSCITAAGGWQLGRAVASCHCRCPLHSPAVLCAQASAVSFS